MTRITTTTVTAHQILVRARSLIADPKSWTQGAMARNAEGDEVDIVSKRAACFCSAGAIYRAETEIAPHSSIAAAASSGASRAIRDVLRDLNHGEDVTIVTVNDRPETTHADILSVFDAAIAAEAPRP